MADDLSTPRYTAADLAERTGVSERTVRYYVAEGLLPPPDGRGRGANFGQGHLLRLRLIKAIQQAGNSLETIGEYLDELGPDEAKTEAALRVWENRQEQARWAETWREKFGAPSTVHRYRFDEGIELLIDVRAAPDPERTLRVLRAIRKALAEEE
jgi:DNA-binding transcriptional MerR regulator